MVSCTVDLNIGEYQKKVPQDLEGQAHYYKKYYNSAQGKASEEEYIEQYKDLIL